MSGVTNALIGMGTDYNLESLKRINITVQELNTATTQDLIICVSAENENIAVQAMEKAEHLLSDKKGQLSRTDEYLPATQAGAQKILPDANIVLISVPGQYATREVKIALESGKHVMLFSDNVSIEDELELKKMAVEKGLLMMGPDCGTSIINGVALAFANAVRRGNIGIAAASGTGLQEVSSIIHKLGCGVSQAIGLGGRDLSDKIQGRMMIQAVHALNEDPDTKVIAIVSKPPADSTFVKLMEAFKSVKKPLVIYFVGADVQVIEKHGFIGALDLEDTAIKACSVSTGKTFSSLITDNEITELSRSVKLEAPYIRGLYSGGTLCDESQRLLLSDLKEIFSNTPVKGCKKLNSIYTSEKHTMLDLGDDDFTRGKAHPMIDPTARVERILSESKDDSVGMILLDVVLGYGSHPDMAGELAKAIHQAKKISKKNVVYLATICGTDEDFQNYRRQKETLVSEGVLVFPSNVSMVKFVKKVFQKGK